MKNYYLLLAALTLTACAQGSWVKKGASPADAEKAYKQCRYEAIKATASCGNPYGCGGERQEVGIACMNLKGFEWQTVK